MNHFSDPCGSLPCDTIANTMRGRCIRDGDSFRCQCAEDFFWSPETRTCLMGKLCNYHLNGMKCYLGKYKVYYMLSQVLVLDAVVVLFCLQIRV